MLEAQLIGEITKAQVLWDMDYGNDAQSIINEAMNMAVDTEWETKIARITENYCTYDQLVETFLANHKGLTKEHLTEISVVRHSLSGKYDETIKKPTEDEIKIVTEFDKILDESDKMWRNQVTQGIDYLLNDLDNAIGDKIHRRNLQIAELKKSKTDPEVIKNLNSRLISTERALLQIKTQNALFRSMLQTIYEQFVVNKWDDWADKIQHIINAIIC